MPTRSRPMQPRQTCHEPTATVRFNETEPLRLRSIGDLSSRFSDAFKAASLAGKLPEIVDRDGNVTDGFQQR